MKGHLKRVALIAVTWLAGFSGALPARAQAPSATARLQEIRQMIMDPGQIFSISATLAELDGLERRLGSEQADPTGHGELNYARGFLHYRAGRPEQAVGPMQTALRIDEGSHFLNEKERARFTYQLASQAEELKLWDTAIDAYRKASAAFEADPAESEDQRAGTLERLAYCLHEARRFGEARTINERVLATGERLFGGDSDKLLVVITNLAQNSYELGDFDAARRYLDRRLAIATAKGRSSHVDDALFQLGVLAFERGQKREAEDFMTRRLEIARRSGDRARITAAEEALAILHEKNR